jgi:hypothetical protein
MSKEAMKLALEALMRSRKAVSGDLDLAGCAYGSRDPDGHRYDSAKKALVTLDKAITALQEALAAPQQEQEPVADVIEELEQMNTQLREQNDAIDVACAKLEAANAKLESASTATLSPVHCERCAEMCYDAPPAPQPAQREWVWLSDDEIHDLQIENIDNPWANFKAIEAKVKEKNT